MRKKIMLGILFICIVMMDSHTFLAEEIQENIYIRAKVIKVIEDNVEEVLTSGEDLVLRSQKLRVKGINKPYKNMLFTAENTFHTDSFYQYIAKEGDKVVLFLEKNETGEITEAYVVEPVRDTCLFYLAGLFIILLVVIGKGKGIKAVITLVLTIGAVLKILLPGILKGYNPILLSIFISTGITIVTLVLVSGWNRKTTTAIIGTIIGVIMAGLIAWWIGQKTHLSGLNNAESQMLMYIPQGTDFDLTGILFAGIILGALGAVMDVSMSIASSMYELTKANTRLTTKELIQSGMNIGKDVMGTMSNTLILAYAGGSIHVMLLFLAYKLSMIEIMNMDMIATEVVRAISGSIGLLFAIPVTTIVGAFLLPQNKIMNEAE